MFPARSGASHFTAHASALSPSHALATLASAAVLVELCAWSDWDTLYAPRLGPLAAFLSKHQQDLGFRVLEVPGRGLLKLPTGPAGGKLDLQQLRAGWKFALEQVHTHAAKAQARMHELFSVTTGVAVRRTGNVLVGGGGYSSFFTSMLAFLS